MATEKTPPKEPLEKAIVARGTIVVDHPTETRTHKGVGGELITLPKPHHVGPGGEVELPASTVARLRASGHLRGKDGTAVSTGVGPVYDQTNGEPTVTEA